MSESTALRNIWIVKRRYVTIELENLLTRDPRNFFSLLRTVCGARGGVMVKALRYNRQVAGSIPDGVTGIFQ